MSCGLRCDLMSPAWLLPSGWGWYPGAAGGGEGVGVESHKLVLVWWRVRLLELGFCDDVPSGCHSHCCTGTSHFTAAAQRPLDFGFRAIILCKWVSGPGSHTHLGVVWPAWQKAEDLGVLGQRLYFGEDISEWPDKDDGQVKNNILWSWKLGALCLGTLSQCLSHAVGCLFNLFDFEMATYVSPEALFSITQFLIGSWNLSLCFKPLGVHLHSSEMPAIPLAQDHFYNLCFWVICPLKQLLF